MENKQTAVNWLIERLTNRQNGVFDGFPIMSLDEMYEQAKQMEKEQIKDAFTDGCIGELYELNAYYTSEKYYNETYNKKDDA